MAGGILVEVNRRVGQVSDAVAVTLAEEVGIPGDVPGADIGVEASAGMGNAVLLDLAADEPTARGSAAAGIGGAEMLVDQGPGSGCRRSNNGRFRDTFGAYIVAYCLRV